MSDSLQKASLEWIDDEGNRWIDGTSGLLSAWGHRATESSPSHGEATDEVITSLLQQLTSCDKQTIANVRVTASLEEALQAVWVFARTARWRGGDVSDSTAESASGSNMPCLAAIGAEHAGGIVSQVLSGTPESRSPAWPTMPGVIHVPIDALAQRIDHGTSMVLLAPIQINHMAAPIDADSLRAIRAACDEHQVPLVIDHSGVPAVGMANGLQADHSSQTLWVHEAVAEVKADAVLMSAGWFGEVPGAVLMMGEMLNDAAESLAASWTHHDISREPFCSHPLLSNLALATLNEWTVSNVLSNGLSEFAVALAERIADREIVRDLHVTGSTIGLELDLPAKEWISVATSHHLKVLPAGDFSVRLHLPLAIEPTDWEGLLDRIDEVFTEIEMAEAEAQVSDMTTQEAPEAELDVELVPEEEPVDSIAKPIGTLDSDGSEAEGSYENAAEPEDAI